MLALNGGTAGPFVMCDTCKGKTYLPGNCLGNWGPKFLIPALAKLGMKREGPHICKGCRNESNATNDRGATGDIASNRGARQNPSAPKPRVA